ncbi:DNA replication/repair protein RecF [Candidatus Margulisiibacteriota bacterium]
MIKKLWVKDFRNFDEFVLDFTEYKDFVFFGDNNQGKTNLLESLYFLGNGHSPNENNINNLVNFNKKEAYLGLDFQKNGANQRIYYKIHKPGKKLGIFNNKQLRTLSLLTKELQIEYISADIIRIFTESPEFRRKEVDRFCKLFFPEYNEELKSYERILRQKNNLIKTSQDLSAIKIWNQKLIEKAEVIVKLRKEALELLLNELKVMVKKIDKQFIKGLSVNYKIFGFTVNQGEIYRNVLESQLNSKAQKEYQVGYALYGPHRDDFCINIDNKDLFSLFSRGINRIFAILFKISQITALVSRNNTVPVLLMDDSLAELDIKMKKKMLGLISNKLQIFYTTVLEEDKKLLSNVKVYQIKKGKLVSG